jgi:hypothetical protein
MTQGALRHSSRRIQDVWHGQPSTSPPNIRCGQTDRRTSKHSSGDAQLLRRDVGRLRSRHQFRLGGPFAVLPRPTRPCFGAPPGQEGDGEALAGADEGAPDDDAVGRIASIWAIAFVSVIGAGTTDRIAPSGPMKNCVGRP